MSISCPGPLNLVCSVVTGGTPVSSVWGYVLTTITGWFTTAATWLLDQLGGVLSATTTPDLNASWYVAHYHTMLALSAVVALPMLGMAVIHSVVRQDAAILARVVLVQLPLAAVLAGVALSAVQLALSVTDGLSSAVASGTGTELQSALSKVAGAFAVSAGTAPGLVVALGAVIVVGGALTLWIELLVRAAAVYVATLFLPIALAGLIWPAVAHWSRRLVETLAALVLSKFVIVTVLSLAVGALGATGAGTGGIATVLTGAAMLLLAAFTPFTLLRLVPLVEAGAALGLEGAHRRVAGSFGSLPYSAARHALQRARDAGLDAGAPGIGSAAMAGAAGLLGMGGGGSDGGGGGGGGEGGGGGGGGEGAGDSASGDWGDYGRDYCGDPSDPVDEDAPYEPRYYWSDGTDGGPPGPRMMAHPTWDKVFEEGLKNPPPPAREATGGWGHGWIRPLWGGEAKKPGADADEEVRTSADRDLLDPDLPPEWRD